MKPVLGHWHTILHKQRNKIIILWAANKRKAEWKRIYLDNCCYNRPYDDQSYISISLETQAKLHIQDLIIKQEFELATSYILRYENSQNPYEMKREAISKFIDDYLDESFKEELEMYRENINQ